MSYTKEDVIEYWESIRPSQKTRKRPYLDERNYILALLHYKYKVTESHLEKIIGIDRSSISHNKKFAYNYTNIQEPTFLLHTSKVRQKFPYEFPKPEIYQAKEYPYSRLYAYRLNLDYKLRTAVRLYCEKRGIHSSTGLRDLVRKGLELWEK